VEQADQVIKEDANRLVVVAGSGRSGTSLFSGILKALGGHVPQPEVAADKTNPRGFGEPQWVVDFHTDLLARANVQTADARPVAWSRTAQVAFDRAVEAQLQKWLKGEFRNGDHVVIKDPRLLWFIPLWTNVGTRTGVGVRFATCLRHPMEVVKSKQTYYGENVHPSSRTAGWINTMLFTERATREGVRAFVKYDDLLTDWTLSLSKVSEALDLKLLERVGTQDLREVSQLVDPSLRRSLSSWDKLGVHKQVADFAEETWDLLDKVATKDIGEDAAIRDEFDKLRERYLDFYDLMEATAQSSVMAAARDQEVKDQNKAAKAAASSSAKQIAKKGKRKAKRALRRVKKRIVAKG
jgi:hypothetical protein